MESQKLLKICQMGTCLAHDFVGGRLGFTCPWLDTECNLKLIQIFYLLISLSLMKDWEKPMKKYRFLALKWQMSRMRKFFPYRSNCHTFFYIVVAPWNAYLYVLEFCFRHNMKATCINPVICFPRVCVFITINKAIYHP